MSFVSYVGPDAEIDAPNGKKYMMSPLSFKELGEFCVWVKFLDYEEAKQIGLDSDELAKAYDKCKKTKTPSISDEVVLEEFRSFRGIAKQLYLSLRINHPDITFAVISKIINMKNMTEISTIIDIINGVEPGTDGEPLKKTTAEKLKIKSQ